MLWFPSFEWHFVCLPPPEASHCLSPSAFGMWSQSHGTRLWCRRLKLKVTLGLWPEDSQGNAGGCSVLMFGVLSWSCLSHDETLSRKYHCFSQNDISCVFRTRTSATLRLFFFPIHTVILRILDPRERGTKLQDSTLHTCRSTGMHPSQVSKINNTITMQHLKIKLVPRVHLYALNPPNLY